MDKVIEYRKLVRKLLSEIANDFRKANRWRIMEIYDETEGQYLLFTDGWKGEVRDYGCFMHLEVKEDGKIWIHRDGTDLDIGQELLDANVPHLDIVLGFLSPKMREYSDFALS